MHRNNLGFRAIQCTAVDTLCELGFSIAIACNPELTPERNFVKNIGFEVVQHINFMTHYFTTVTNASPIQLKIDIPL